MQGHEAGAVIKPLVSLGKTPDDCWQWIGNILPNGYGKKTLGGKTMLAHRWLWSQLFGPIPEGMVIDHKCQNTACVNPHHLRIVTQADNVRAGVRTVLTSGDVAEVRRLSETGWFPDNIAAKFGVATATVKSILQGKSWRTPKKFYGAKKHAPKAA